MLPLLPVVWMLAQAPVSQPYKDDSVTSAALARTMKYRVLLPEGYGRSRAGLSRGGYGALKIGFETPGFFLPWLMKAVRNAEGR